MANLGKRFSPVNEVPEELQIQTSPWLAQFLDLDAIIRWPLHRRRWGAVRFEIQREVENRARLHDTTPERELLLSARAALSLAIAEKARLPESEWQRHLKSRLNDLVTLDLLGPEWRRGCAKYWPPEELDPIAEIERRLLLDQLVASANLSAMEKAVIQAERADVPDDQLAAQYGIAPGTIRVHRHRAHQKLQERRDLAM